MTKLLEVTIKELEKFKGMTIGDEEVRMLTYLIEAAHSAGMIDQMSKDSREMDKFIKRITIN